jgi:hypothetical protein
MTVARHWQPRRESASQNTHSQGHPAAAFAALEICIKHMLHAETLNMAAGAAGDSTQLLGKP